MQSEAAIRLGVYASFASLMKFGGSSCILDAPHTFQGVVILVGKFGQALMDRETVLN
jgi:hypothetical protein